MEPILPISAEQERGVFIKSAETPYLSTKSQRMLSELKNGGVLALWCYLCRVARREKERSEPDYPGLDILQVKDSMSKVLADQTGQRHVLRLLVSMPPEVIEALITNTIGWHYKNTPHFQEFFDSNDENAGIYINTLVRDDSGTFLTRNELEAYQSMLERYIKPVHNGHEAMAIDSALGSSKSRRFDIAKGKRTWYNLGGTEKHLAAVSLRINPQLDVGGDIPQHQSAIQVESSHNIARRIKQHNPQSDLSSSTNPWCLMLSYLTVTAIGFKIVALPILHIWQQDQRALAEILITMLAGSLVEEGGYNPIQAGTSIGVSKLSYYNESVKVFITTPWLANGLEMLSNDLRRRENIFKTFKEFMTFDFVRGTKELSDAVSDVSDSLKRLEVEVEQTKKLMEEAEIAGNEAERLDNITIQRLTEQLKLIDMAGAWLSK